MVVTASTVLQTADKTDCNEVALTSRQHVHCNVSELRAPPIPLQETAVLPFVLQVNIFDVEPFGVR